MMIRQEQGDMSDQEWEDYTDVLAERYLEQRQDDEREEQRNG